MSAPEGLTSEAVAGYLRDQGATGVVSHSDRHHSISARVVRGHLGHRVVGGAGVDAKHQLNAVMDLVAFALAQPHLPVGVDVYLARRPGDEELPAAARTLAAAVTVDLDLRVFLLDAHGTPLEVAPGATTFESADEHRYTRWPHLLDRVQDGPPDYVRDLVTRADLDAPLAVRAYPSLSREAAWTIRVEGLTVGAFDPRGGTLGVGRPGTVTDSRKRALWTDAAETADAVPVLPDGDLDRPADLIRRFAVQLRTQLAAVADEHALESRVLRGAVPVAVQSGTTLALLKRDPVVNWGSQFPTRWGPRAGAGRYLDALLRDGTTPWALEIKVASGQGTRQYYRHAVHQAVLYRQFITTATPLCGWFDMQGLDPTACRAAVVVPDGCPPSHLDELGKLADKFDVEIIEVEKAGAVYGGGPAQ